MSLQQKGVGTHWRNGGPPNHHHERGGNVFYTQRMPLKTEEVHTVRHAQAVGHYNKAVYWRRHGP